MQKNIPKEWFARDAVIVAKELLGKRIAYAGSSGVIVETEAYTTDPASHAHRITPRSEIMQNTYGVFYIYFVYGMYFCLNITTNKGSTGAVLIRALEPLTGIDIMKSRRKNTDVRDLTNGPGKLCTALGITKELNGTEVNTTIRVCTGRALDDAQIDTSSRIGITKGTDLDWRFFVKENAYVSKTSKK